MNTTTFIFLKSALMTLGFICATLLSAATKPNIIFFITDDMDMDLYTSSEEGVGNNLTPNLARLAEEGTIFHNQYIPTTICSPSRYSSLTGLYGHASRTCQNDRISRAIDFPFVTYNAVMNKHDDNIARTLQAAGYTTGMVGKAHFVGHRFTDKIELAGDSDPSDPEVQQALLHNYQLEVEVLKDVGFDEVNSLYFHGDVRQHKVEALRSHNMDWVAKGALDFLDHAASVEKPFYAYVAPTLPHEPHAGRRSWNADARITPMGMLEEPVQVLPDRADIPNRLAAAGIPLVTERTITGNGICPLCAHGMLCEDRRAMMVSIDDTLGAMLDKLEANGQLDNTIIFFFNDHGQAGKSTIYESGAVSPSVIWKSDRFPIGAETEAFVSNIDFAPTIADLAGVELPYEADGVSLLPLLEGETDSVRDSVYMELGFSRGVRKGDWKYIALRYTQSAVDLGICDLTEDGIRSRFGHMGRLGGESPAERYYDMIKRVERAYPHYYDEDQLYHLEADPTEQNNLAEDRRFKEVLAEMKAELTKHLSTSPGTFGEFTTK
jgi:arylsulfatase A-like enzyme